MVHHDRWVHLVRHRHDVTCGVTVMPSLKYTEYDRVNRFIEGVIILSRYGDPTPCPVHDRIYCGPDLGDARVCISMADEQRMVYLGWVRDLDVNRWGFSMSC